MLQTEQRANVFEIAAWAEEPGTAPVRHNERERMRGWKDKRKEKKRRENEAKVQKRGGANAFAVKEWEGIAS